MLNFEQRRSTYDGGVLAAALYPLLVVISENPANPGQCLNPKLPVLRGCTPSGHQNCTPKLRQRASPSMSQ